jgi:predicted O-methyltransferase YrrM
MSLVLGAIDTTVRDRYCHWLTVESDIQSHLPLLHAYAQGDILEIGVRDGASTSALLYGAEQWKGRLYSVDRDDCSRLFAGHPRWTFIQADSVTEAAVVLARVPDHLDLLLVDGDHSYQSCSSDLWTYGTRAKVIAVHDTAAPAWPDVALAVRDYFRDTEFQTCEYRKGSYGMAILRREL